MLLDVCPRHNHAQTAPVAVIWAVPPLLMKASSTSLGGLGFQFAGFVQSPV